MSEKKNPGYEKQISRVQAPVDDAEEMVFSVIRRQERNRSAPFEKKKTGEKIGEEQEWIPRWMGKNDGEQSVGTIAGTGAGSEYIEFSFGG